MTADDRMPAFLITCNGGGSHASKVATVALFKRWREGQWLSINPESTHGRSGIAEIDGVRHAENPEQEILSSTGLPLEIESLVSDPGQKQRRRYRLECQLCKMRKTPNTVVVDGVRMNKILNLLHGGGYSSLSLDGIRATLISSKID